MLRKIVSLLSVIYIAVVSPVQAQQDNSDSVTESAVPQRYVSDSLYIFMHAGPGRQFRILGSVNAGEPIDILQVSDDGSYTEVLSARQRTGWIESQYVSEKIPAKNQLEAAFSERDQAIEASQRIKTQLQKANAINDNLQQEILSLNNQNNELKRQNESLTISVATSNKNESREWLIKGGIMVLVSVLFGYILSVLPRRKKRRSEWA